MTVIQQGLPIDKISDEARKLTFARVLLSIVGGLFYAIGWITGRVWLGVMWCLVAVKVGFQDAKNKRDDRTG